MLFEITEWHHENPNCWVALEMTDIPKKGWGHNPNKYILRARANTLLEFPQEIRDKDYTYAKSWGMGIGKDMEIGESRDEYYKRKGFLIT